MKWSAGTESPKLKAPANATDCHHHIYNAKFPVDPKATLRPGDALVDDDSDVSVDTSGNTVTLRGHVRTWAERDAVVSAAWMAGGVMQVRNDLDITG